MANKPNIRFKGFTDDWEQRKLGEICERLTRKNKDNESDLPLTISSQHGLIDQRDFFNKVVAAKDMSEYYLLQKGEFAYNKSYSNGYDYGSIKRLNSYEKGCLSTLYICFKLISDKVNSDYLECYFDTLAWYHDVSQICSEGARNHGLLNVDVKAFFTEVTVKLPVDVKEQQQISAILHSLDHLITLHQRKCDETKKLKKFMLQKMFPKNGEKNPEIRFAGFTDDWEQRKLGEMSNSYSGGTPKVGTSKYYGGKIPFIRSAEINSDTTELFLTEEGLKCSSARLVDTGDILYALYGATSGEVGRARIKGAINQAILVIKPQAGYDYEFLTQWLRKSKLNIIDRYLQGGQGNLSGTIVNELLVEFPNYEEQTKIGTYFSTLDHLITLHQRKCDNLKLIKKFMLQNMFPKKG